MSVPSKPGEKPVGAKPLSSGPKIEKSILPLCSAVVHSIVSLRHTRGPTPTQKTALMAKDTKTGNGRDGWLGRRHACQLLTAGILDRCGTVSGNVRGGRGRHQGCTYGCLLAETVPMSPLKSEKVAGQKERRAARAGCGAYVLHKWHDGSNTLAKPVALLG